MADYEGKKVVDIKARPSPQFSQTVLLGPHVAHRLKHRAELPPPHP